MVLWKRSLFVLLQLVGLLKGSEPSETAWTPVEIVRTMPGLDKDQMKGVKKGILAAKGCEKLKVAKY